MHVCVTFCLPPISVFEAFECPCSEYAHNLRALAIFGHAYWRSVFGANQDPLTVADALMNLNGMQA